MASGDQALEAFKAQLPASSMQLLQQLADRLASIVGDKPSGRVSASDLTRSVAKAMPFLSAYEAQALTTVAILVGGGKLLQVQMAMQRENIIFTSVSNVLKTRHDTVKNSIGNVR